eukprot:scaffold819_cov350-Prasinococcus_capsulatus_cf.AAC.3
MALDGGGMRGAREVIQAGAERLGVELLVHLRRAALAPTPAVGARQLALLGVVEPLEPPAREHKARSLPDDGLRHSSLAGARGHLLHSMPPHGAHLCRRGSAPRKKSRTACASSAALALAPLQLSESWAA